MLTGKRIAAALAVLIACTLWLLGSPSPEERLSKKRTELEQQLATGAVRIDPAELLELNYNPSAHLRLLDLRDENEYNLFHLVDAERITLEQLRDRRFAMNLPPETIVVLISNGEGQAAEGWLLLTAARAPRIYLLAGGINGWLTAFGRPGLLRPMRADCPADDCRRYAFDAALGGRHPESDPGLKAIEGRSFTRKIKIEGPQKRKAGSCG